jgi:HEAT repeat protein
LEDIGTSARDSVGALADAVRDQSSDSCKTIDVAAAGQESQMDLGWTVRWAAARALGAINADPDRTTAALQAALTDSMWQVRGVAALSLGNVRTPASVNALSGALSDKVGAVRKAAAIALGVLGRDAHAALPALQNTASDPDQAVRDAGLAAIDRIVAN